MWHDLIAKISYDKDLVMAADLFEDSRSQEWVLFIFIYFKENITTS